MLINLKLTKAVSFIADSMENSNLIENTICSNIILKTIYKKKELRKIEVRGVAILEDIPNSQLQRN